MSTTTALLHQQHQFQQQEHNIELMCRICASDFKIASEGVSILTTEQLMDKIRNYLHIQVNNLDKLSHLVCNECVRKIENFHCYALMAQKNQELFNIMYSEKIYREHCTALSSLNTTLYREPPTPQIQQVQTKFNEQSKPQPAISSQLSPPLKKPKFHANKPSALSLLPSAAVISSTIAQANSPQQPGSQQPVAVLSTEDITIFTYQDLKLGQVIKDQELQKLILRALKWNEAGKSIDTQLDRLKNTSFRAVLNNPDLLRDEDLVQLLGPYLDHGSFAALDTNKSSNIEFSSNSKFMDQNVTEMEVGVDPDLFFPYDDEESSKGMELEVTKVVQKPKKERKKSETKSKSTNKKNSMAVLSAASSATSVITTTIVTPTTASGKIRVKSESQLFNTTIVPTTTIAQTTVTPEKPIPKPIIVIPTPKPTIRQTNAQTQQSKAAKKPELNVPSAIQIIPEPIITAPSKIVQAPKAVPPPIIKILIPPKKPEVTIDLEPSPTNSSQPEKSAPTTKSTAASTSAVTTTVPTKSSINKPELKPKLQRKVKINDTKIGPKTRARSVFNARHKCAVAGCSRKFSTMSNLKAHVKTHKPKGKFICEKCSRVFKTEANLNRHKEYHAGEKFACRTCNRVYPSNSTLKQHEIAHSNVRNFECKVCLKSFKRSQDLKFHINQHTGSRPYQCPYCPKKFASSGNCFSHRKRVHSDKTLNSPTTPTSKRISSIEASNNKKLLKA